MKTEIKNIKTHFATKAELIRWTVGVGIATILSIAGFILEFRKEMRSDLQNIRQDMKNRQQDMHKLQLETRHSLEALARKIDALL